jgi:hypothetical protein
MTNAVMKTEGLAPDMLWIGNSNRLKVAGRESKFQSAIHMVIKGIRFDIQDVHLKYQRLSFPKISDEGSLNVRAVGGGLQIEAWLSADAEDDRMFRVDDVDAQISGLQIYDMDFKKHDMLYSIFKPLIEYSVRKRAEEAIEEKLKQTVFDLRKLTSANLGVL